MVNSPLVRPYLLGGGSFGGGTLDSHDFMFFLSSYKVGVSDPVISGGKRAPVVFHSLFHR